MPDQTVVDFYFGRRQLQGIEGESIAAALFKADIRTLSYSVKYKRPRGLHCMRGRCVMCHMEVDGTPGVPTCLTPLRAGMRVQREDYRPFYAPFLTLVARLVPLPAGFYYRMFTRPAVVRRFFLGSLRKMAGVGRLQPAIRGEAARPQRRAGATRVALAYDVVVVGAGLSGMAAAVAASAKGASVLVVDEYDHPGGHSIGHGPRDAVAARDELIDQFGAARTITFLPRTTAQAFYKPNTLLLGPGGAVEQTGDGLAAMHRVSAPCFVFATGAYDLVPTFDGNDVPGVFGARAMRLLLERDGLVPGRSAVVYGIGDDLADAVNLLKNHGVRVAATVDPSPGAASPGGDPHFAGMKLKAADEKDWMSSVTLANGKKISCDLLCTAFRGQGAYELAYQAGFSLEMTAGEINEARVMAPTETSLAANGVQFFVTGDLAGTRDWREKIASGKRVAESAAASATTG